MKINLFWFRRDLRLKDNTAFNAALKNKNVKPIFIFDDFILNKLEKNDSRLTFIHSLLLQINKDLNKYDSSVFCYYGSPLKIWQKIISHHDIDTVFWNKDYEPYAKKRDHEISKLLNSNNINVKTFKDQVVFEEFDIVKDDGNPYLVFTPYKKKWLSIYNNLLRCGSERLNFEANFSNLLKQKSRIISLSELGFVKSDLKVKDYNLDYISNYDAIRNNPHQDQTSYLSPHLRFGTISIRQCVDIAMQKNSTFLSELIWREFFMQILFHFPHVQTSCFKLKYENIKWRNNKNDFEKWCNGFTGYPLVDAGMRQLNKTGYMHNRVRMITASFLVKHLLIDWRWGESYFATKLLDYDLSSNNGNWQWVAGTGCDSAPYFRIFNPKEQLRKFDKQCLYVKRWVEDFGQSSYPNEIIDHKFARNRCLETYKKILY